MPNIIKSKSQRSKRLRKHPNGKKQVQQRMETISGTTTQLPNTHITLNEPELLLVMQAAWTECRHIGEAQHTITAPSIATTPEKARVTRNTIRKHRTATFTRYRKDTATNTDDEAEESHKHRTTTELNGLS